MIIEGGKKMGHAFVVVNPPSPLRYIFFFEGTARTVESRTEKFVHFKGMEHQLRESRAWHQTRLHRTILQENRKQFVCREDHVIMAKILLAEARRADPNLTQNREKWRRIHASIDKEASCSNSILSIAADPYASIISKLSSMMLWTADENIRCWTFKYNGYEMTRRQLSQAATLAEVNEKRQTVAQVNES